MDVPADWPQRLRVVLMLCAATAAGGSAQTFTSLASFNITDGDNPFFAPLVQGTDGNLYGTAENGGTSNSCNGGCGTIFKITPMGVLTTLHSFDSTDGQYPQAGLVLATDGSMYGATELGGAHGDGVIFRVTDGKLSVLYNFCAQAGCLDGNGPNGLVQATNGDFYGTTVAGGATGDGTIYKITPAGALSTLYSFSGTDGSKPIGALIQATDGNLYGTTTYGGTNGGFGTVFKISLGGTLTSLHSFEGTDGAYPQSGLVQASNGKFYGTTFQGGPTNSCGPYGCGTVFQVTAGGDLATLYGFCAQANCAEGKYPVAGLTQATDGNLYGIAGNGGAREGEGTIFQITLTGSLTTLYSFCATGFPCTGGFDVDATLIQGTDGNLYGTSGEGGSTNNPACYFGASSDGCGTVFSLSLGLGSFVTTLPHLGHEGAVVIILGTDLTGATGLRFNGTPAVFTVVSATEISTTVPAGATTGRVQVTTPGGALFSGGPFVVRP